MKIFVRKLDGKLFDNGEYRIIVRDKVYKYTENKYYYVQKHNDKFIPADNVYIVNDDSSLTDFEKSYINRPIEQEHLTLKDFAKIYRLKEKENIRKKYKKNQSRYRPITEGDKVYIKLKLNGKIEKIGGIVRKVYNDNYYDITSGTLYFKKIKLSRYKYSNYNCIYHRKSDNLTNIDIEIYPELKKLSTYRLLNLYKNSRFTGKFFYNFKIYPRIIVKAMLNTRDDIPNKNIKKTVNKIKKLKKHKNIILR